MALFEGGQRIRISSKITIIKKLREIILQILGVLFKFDCEDTGDFAIGAGGTYERVVVFSTAYSDTDYTVQITVESTGCSFSPTVKNKLTTGFTIDLGTNNKTGLGSVCWQTLNFEPV